jgi:tetratricopeptide (TPR) repeat protein/peroxiredoxin
VPGQLSSGYLSIAPALYLQCFPRLHPRYPHKGIYKHGRCRNLTPFSCGCYVFCRGTRAFGGIALNKHSKGHSSVDLSRRKLLLQLGQGVAAFSFFPADLRLSPIGSAITDGASLPNTAFHLHPQYQGTREVDSVLQYVRAGSDAFVTEKLQDQVAGVLGEWRSDLLGSPQNTSAIGRVLHDNFLATSPVAISSVPLRPDSSLKVARLQFSEEETLSAEPFLRAWRSSLHALSQWLTVEFQVIGIRSEPSQPPSAGVPLSLETRIRYELVGTGAGFFREQRIGNWDLRWELLPGGELRLRNWKILGETRGRSLIPVFADVAPQSFAGRASFAQQLRYGSDYWRTALDGACGIDIYGHNGVSVGDIDGDGFDDLYICQPAGLPNRLYRNRGDGTFEDLTENSGLGLLDNTACALFADIDNDGRQDLIVVRTTGPLLFMNQGGGRFRQKLDAFQFANPPQGTFTGAAIADYDRDGWLDIYFCLYAYYQGADQYRYPCPYFDARNGPPNFLMRNRRDATFRDVTQESGLSVDNNRFSFCCAWGDASGDSWPDLYVVNDFGLKNLYRNNRDATFTDIAELAGVEDVGAGMSASWLDFDGDGKSDLYVVDMWTAAGVRISGQDIFQPNAEPLVRTRYRKHAMGNSLFRNLGGDKFADDTARSETAIGRWAWSSDAWDFDHDGFPDLYIANGMISGPSREDLNSFFWRQVVANSPQGSQPARAYELGWNAINELIRADGTWSGFERNIFYLNNRDGTFSDVSGIAGLDFIEDGRSFALADFDHDGRVEVLLKNRSGPQIRLLKNVLPELPPAIAFRLHGKKSNRDAIGAAVTVETGARRQTLFVQAGSGFLAQHSKELFFGLGDQHTPVKASIRWPSGLVQTLNDLPLNHRIVIEEGSPPSRTEAFRIAAAGTAQTAVAISAATSFAAAQVERPETMETWLLAPFAAPDFTASDLRENRQTLSQLRGKPVLLYFLTMASPLCRRGLMQFQQAHARWSSAGLQFVAVIADDAAGPESDPFANLRQRPFPVLPFTADLPGVYNLLFRSLFDRHRDMPLPVSFLLDEQGAIVKIYQGAIQPGAVEHDCRNIPRTPAERLAKALPFPGVSGHYEFGRNYLSYGSVFFERGYLAPAEEFFQLALKDDPSGAEAHYGLGSVYLQQQKSGEARKSFARAVQLQAAYPGTLPRAWNNLGILEAREGRTEAAIANFQQALKADPEYGVALVNLGNACRQDQQWENAKNAFRRALELNPQDAEADYGLGMIYAQLDDTEQAYDFLQKALAARPIYPEALNNLGILYLRTNRKEEAEKSFEESIRVAPAFDQSYLNLARLYAIEDHPQKARAILLELLKQHPGHSQAEKELSQLPQ